MGVLLILVPAVAVLLLNLPLRRIPERVALPLVAAVSLAEGAAASGLAALSRALHNGTHARYLAWAVAGTALVVLALLGGF